MTYRNSLILHSNYENFNMLLYVWWICLILLMSSRNLRFFLSECKYDGHKIFWYLNTKRLFLLIMFHLINFIRFIYILRSVNRIAVVRFLLIISRLTWYFFFNFLCTLTGWISNENKWVNKEEFEFEMLNFFSYIVRMSSKQLQKKTR